MSPAVADSSPLDALRQRNRDRVVDSTGVIGLYEYGWMDRILFMSFPSKEAQAPSNLQVSLQEVNLFMDQWIYFYATREERNKEYQRLIYVVSPSKLECLECQN